MGFWNWLFGSGSGSSVPPPSEYRNSGRVINKNLFPFSPVSSGEAINEASQPTVRNPTTGESHPRFIEERGETYRLAYFDTGGRPVYGNPPRILSVFDLNDYGG
jgi:hypothetical protein